MPMIVDSWDNWISLYISGQVVVVGNKGGPMPADYLGGRDFDGARQQQSNTANKLGTCTGWWGADDLGLMMGMM